MLVLEWCGVYFYTSSSENDRKMKKIMISSDLLGLPWQHEIYDKDFKKVFLTIMFCLYIVSKNSKIIQLVMFSEIVRPKMGLIDPKPLALIGQAVSEENMFEKW